MLKFNLGKLGVAAVGLAIANPAVAATLTAPTQNRSADWFMAPAELQSTGATQWSSDTIDVSRQSPMTIPANNLAGREASGVAQPSSGVIDGRRQSPLLVAGEGLDSAVPVSAVPEPTTWALMILGFGMVGAALRRRRRSTDSAGTNRDIAQYVPI